MTNQIYIYECKGNKTFSFITFTKKVMKSAISNDENNIKQSQIVSINDITNLKISKKKKLLLNFQANVP